MPHFLLKQSLASVTLIAIGTAGIGYLLALPENTPAPIGNAGAMIFWIGGGACIGAGVLNLFNRWKSGAIIGALVQVVMFIHALITTPI